jgi:hypothetical protein
MARKILCNLTSHVGITNRADRRPIYLQIAFGMVLKD